MSYRHNDNPVRLLEKDHAPVADPQPSARAALEALYIAVPTFRKGIRTPIDASADISGKPHPLPRRRRREGD